MSAEFVKSNIDTKGIESALARAAQRAAKIARETGTPLILWKDGRVVEISPDQLSHQDLQDNISPEINF